MGDGCCFLYGDSSAYQKKRGRDRPSLLILLVKKQLPRGKSLSTACLPIRIPNQAYDLKFNPASTHLHHGAAMAAQSGHDPLIRPCLLPLVEG